MLNDARRNGRKTLLLELPHEQGITAKDVGLAAEKGDAVARRILTICGRKLGLALAILVDVLNPERIVIGGLAMRLGDLILEPARQALRKEALQPALAACSVVPAMLGERIGDIAALCVAMGGTREDAAAE